MKVIQILAALTLVGPRAIEACSCEAPVDMRSALSTQRNVVGVIIDQELKSQNASDRLFRGFLSTVVKTNDFLAEESTLVVKTEAGTCGVDLQLGSSYVLFGNVQRIPLDGSTFQPVLIINSCAPQKQFAELTGEEANLLSGTSGKIFGAPNDPENGGASSGGFNGGGGSSGEISGGGGSSGGFNGGGGSSGEISGGSPPNNSPVPGPPDSGPTFGSPDNSPVPGPPGTGPTFGTSPVVVPTSDPTTQPTTSSPTEYPTMSPVTPYPTAYPTKHPSQGPTMHPTSHPTSHPTDQPVPAPAPKPSTQPVPAPVVKPTTKPVLQCYADSDCGYYSYCKYGVCTDEKPNSHPNAAPTYGNNHCKYTIDCAYGAECIGGLCHAVIAERPPTSCTYNAQCGGGDAICLGGMCHFDGYQYDSNKCYYDVDCDYGFICASGYCEKDDRYSTGAHVDRGYDKTCRYASECRYGDICKGGICLPAYVAQAKDKSYGDGYRKLYDSAPNVGDYQKQQHVITPMHAYHNSLRLDHATPHSYGSQPYISSEVPFYDEVCKRDEDCGRQKGYCGSGVCLVHGQCMSNDDCYNPSNYVGPGVRGLAELVCVEGTCEQHLCVVADCVGASPCGGASCGDYYESCVVDYCGTECTARYFNRIGEAVCQ